MAVRWLVDGNNVMGSRPDGWWNDRQGAMARLTQEIAEWCRTHDDPVVVVFDGASRPPVAALAGGNLDVRFAPSRRRNGADDVLVALATTADDGGAAEAEVGLVDRVVTADRGLVARLPDHVDVIGPRRFLRLVEAAA
jgi:hypothetical protein